MGLRVGSLGVGVQSTAMLVLSAHHEIEFPIWLWANVGDDSEDPLTVAYFHQHLMPFARAHGLEVHELHRTRRGGVTETLYGRMVKPGPPRLPIPLRAAGNGAPWKRECTHDFKVAVVGRWLRQHGACAADPATVAVGISVDEIQRASNRQNQPYEEVSYPLLDLRLRRADCERIIADAGLPVPAPSSCWFCPFHRPSVWEEMRRDRPELFWSAVGLEQLINARRRGQGRDPLYLSARGLPLDRAMGEAQAALFGTAPVGADVGCDQGWCMT